MVVLPGSNLLHTLSLNLENIFFFAKTPKTVEVATLEPPIFELHDDGTYNDFTYRLYL
jgi:hypothetical protein